MITNVNQLIELCTAELYDRQYRASHLDQIKAHWKKFSDWMENQQFNLFSEELAKQYCDQMIGTHLLVPNMSLQDKILLRSIRLLISYQKDGEFEFRSPRVEYKFEGKTGRMMRSFLDYAATTLNRSSATLGTYRITLYRFLVFMETKGIEIDDITVDVVQEFLNTFCKTISSRYCYNNNLKQFFRYLYANHLSKADLSVNIFPISCRRGSTIPTTYTEEEIHHIIEGPERSSAIGKRDYLVLLLAGEYGWRSSDITHFRLDQIDWDKNVIRFDQCKTGIPVEFPLLSSVGNAIIDYLKHGRPVSDCPEVILSSAHSQKIGPLKSPTIHSIVSRYMKKAKITGWSKKKHGAHSLRHSLASNLLKRNTSLPIISTVLGHQSTESTRIYLKIDYTKLKNCCLPMPEILSPFYRKGGESE